MDPSSCSPLLRRTLACLSIAALAACVDGASAAGKQPDLPPGATVLLPRDDLPGLGNFAQVTEGLYRGEQPTAEGMKELARLGIKTVVNLRTFHSDRSELRGTGLQYAHIHCKTWHPESEDVVRFLAIVRDPANRPVFVHCQHGSDRTGMMIAAYRVVEQGWTPDEAAAELPRFGFHEIWQRIRQQLASLDAAAIDRRVEERPREKLEVVR